MSKVFLFQAKDIKIISDKAYNSARFNDFKNVHPLKWIRLEPDNPSVSDKLRGYYWGAIIPTVKATVPEWERLKDEDIHEILKREFNGFNYFSPITKKTERVGRTAMSGESNSGRAMDFIEKIRFWIAQEYFVELPTPDEYKKLLDQAILIKKDGSKYPEIKNKERKRS